MISIVIPAHNEEAVLGPTLEALNSAARNTGRPYELIVVDDASTDATAEIARAHGASVVPVELRKISAVRNAGAKVARGDLLVFVDADTLIPAATLKAALEAVDRGAVGGGALLGMDEGAPLWARAMMQPSAWGFYLLRIATGCFVYARRAAFEAVGGFDENYFAGEELVLSKALKKHGRFVIVRPAVISSGRKFRQYGFRHTLRTLLRLAGGGHAGLKKKERLSFWYRAMREPPPPNE